MSTQSITLDKQEIILSSALYLFIRHGFHGTPTSKIASEAGIAHGSLFHYFKTKDELVFTLYNSIIANFREYLSENVIASTQIKERFRSLYYKSVQWSLQYRDEFYFTQQFYYSPYFKQSGIEEIVFHTTLHKELYDEALLTKTFKPVPVDLIASLFRAQLIATHTYLVQVNCPDNKERTEQLFEFTWAMFAKTEQLNDSSSLDQVSHS